MSDTDLRLFRKYKQSPARKKKSALEGVFCDVASFLQVIYRLQLGLPTSGQGPHRENQNCGDDKQGNIGWWVFAGDRSHPACGLSSALIWCLLHDKSSQCPVQRYITYLVCNLNPAKGNNRKLKETMRSGKLPRVCLLDPFMVNMKRIALWHESNKKERIICWIIILR